MTSRSRIVHAFSKEEVDSVQQMLGDLVRALRVVPGGGKVEERHWSHIYHAVRKAPTVGWSNLPMRDFRHGGLGVEMKLLKRRSPLRDQGRRLMHPSATRRIEFDPSLDAGVCKKQVLTQFADQISAFRERVAETAAEVTPDIRWGVFLWNPSLEEFLYFEEVMEEPDPDDFYADFVEVRHRGRPTRSLYIFEKETGIKRYSVTMPERGAKIQPYFDIPYVGRGAYAFTVPNDKLKPVWLNNEAFDALQKASRGQDLNEFVLAALRALKELAASKR